MSKQDGIGTWVWNEGVSAYGPMCYIASYDSEISPIPNYLFSFTCDGASYIGLSGSSLGPMQEGVTVIEMEATPIGGFYWADQKYRIIDIKTAPPAEFLTILQPNATYQGGAEPAPSGTVITYNGATIATLSEGQTGTLSCGGKKAVSDIAVAFAAAGKVTYNGTETAVEAGKTATLSCGGKKMVTDVVVKVGGSEPTGDELLGTWVFKEKLNDTVLETTHLSFISNSVSFTSVRRVIGGADKSDSLVYSPGSSVYSGWNLITPWENEAYRTITITDTSTLTNRAEFTEWLKANATKQ